MQSEIKKNEQFEAKIDALTSNCEGVARVLGEVVFVQNAIDGETIKAQVINTKNKYAIAKTIEVIKCSNDRIVPKCPHFLKCGGCDCQHMTYEHSLKFKEQVVRDCFVKIAKIEPHILPCEPSNEIWNYRNKMALPVVESNELPVIGMFRENSHTIIEIEECFLLRKWSKILINIFRKWMKIENLHAFSTDNTTGKIRHLVAREVDDAILITIVVSNNKGIRFDSLVEMLKQNFPKFGLNININSKPNNAILSNKYEHIYGIKSLKTTSCGIKLTISSASFMQINDDISNKIYNEVLNNINIDDVVVDAYSGAGFLSAQIAKKAKMVYGIEIVPQATENANEVVKENDIKNMKNICGDCSIELPKLAKTLSNFVVVLDPPRKGCDEKVLGVIVETKPEKVIYVSCNPATLARDVEKIKDDYKIENIKPFDMFPQTKHVETVCILRKNNEK